MTLADEVLAERRRRSGNPRYVHLSEEMIDACTVFERWLQVAMQNREAVVSVLPPMHAEGLDPRFTAKPRRKK